MRESYIRIFRIISVGIILLILTSFHFIVDLLLKRKIQPLYLVWTFPLIIYILTIAFGFSGGVITGLILSIIAVYIILLTGCNTILWIIAFLILQLMAIFYYLKFSERKKMNIELATETLKEDLVYAELEYKKDKKSREINKKKLERYLKLQNIAESVISSLSHEEITKKIINHVIDNIPNGSRYSLWEIGKDLGSVRLILVKDMNLNGVVDVVHNDDFNKWMIRHRYPLLVENLLTDFRFDGDRLISCIHTRSLISVPMMTRDKIMGILRVESFRAKQFTMDDLRILAIIGSIGTLSMYNANLFKQTEYLAKHDVLTGMFVKREINDYIQELQREISSGKAIHLSILMFDLDYFKNVNDKYGHIIGDKVLKEVANVIKNVVGKEGQCYRYGGEEFAAVLYDISKKDAFNLAEKIRSKIEEKIFYVRNEDIKITISVGVSTFPRDTRELNKLINMADNALYAAKSLGRNKVVMWGEEK